MAFQATRKAPTSALRFWELARKFNESDTEQRRSFKGIERQIWTIARSTGVDFEDLCQETFVVCAEKFSTYQKSKSALNTWIRWQARQAALRLSRQGTKHSIVDGEQATVKMETEWPEDDELAFEVCETERDSDTKILLDTRLSNGKTVRELAQFLLLGKSKGIIEASKAWGCTKAEVTNLIKEARDKI